MTRSARQPRTKIPDDDAAAPSADMAELTDAIRSLKDEIAVLRMSIDELRDDVMWAVRNLTISDGVTRPLQINSLPLDPAAADFHEHVNTADVPFERNQTELQLTPATLATPSSPEPQAAELSKVDFENPDTLLRCDNCNGVFPLDEFEACGANFDPNSDEWGTIPSDQDKLLCPGCHVWVDATVDSTVEDASEDEDEESDSSPPTREASGLSTEHATPANVGSPSTEPRSSPEKTTPSPVTKPVANVASTSPHSRSKQPLYLRIGFQRHLTDIVRLFGYGTTPFEVAKEKIRPLRATYGDEKIADGVEELIEISEGNSPTCRLKNHVRVLAVGILGKPSAT